ncbi:MAG: hypothetical protein J6N56_02185 [Bacteroidales bacterium]|nr:hypothetical protein [Bacteroidales bacterium]
MPLWDNSPADDIIETKAIQLSKNENNVIGDIVVYYVDSNGNHQYDNGEEIVHSAKVKEVDSKGYTITVVSKLGADGISENHPDAPGFYDKNVNGEKTSRAYFRIPH